MQDRFKFRSYGRPNSIIEGMQNIYTFEESKDGYFNVKVDKGWLSFVKEEDLKIMQCTGLKDKNGKLIYEGDIVKYFYPAEYCSDGLHKCPECYSGENGSVHYDEDLAMYEYRSKSDQCPLTDNINTEEDLEVIGNIYENGDLLNEQIS